MQAPRKKLTDILGGDNATRLQATWNEAQAAGDLKPLPTGEYLARILSGDLFNAKSGTPGYKVTLEVTEGEHVGRKLWHDVWLTPAAMPMAKRDLGKIGVTDFEQLDRPLPTGILVRVKVAIRREADGPEFNRVKSFDFVGIEKGDAFAPDAQEVTEEDLSFDPAELDARAAPTADPTTATPSMNGTTKLKGGKKS